MPVLRQQASAGPGSPPSADQAPRRRQGRDDERRLSIGSAGRDDRSLSKARQPADRRRVAAGTDQERATAGFHFSCKTQLFAASRSGQCAAGPGDRRQLWQGQHRGPGRSERPDEGRRTPLRDIPGRRDQDDPQVCRFSGGRRDPSRRHFVVRRYAVRSVGRNRMVAGLVAARRAFQTPSDRAALLFSRCLRPNQFNADSNGCAAGNTPEEAILQGFLELVERDASRSGGTTACNAPRSISIGLATVIFGICEPNSLRRDAACGCWM